MEDWDYALHLDPVRALRQDFLHLQNAIWLQIEVDEPDYLLFETNYLLSLAHVFAKSRFLGGLGERLRLRVESYRVENFSDFNVFELIYFDCEVNTRCDRKQLIRLLGLKLGVLVQTHKSVVHEGV